jgi:hypothetical protein
MLQNEFDRITNGIGGVYSSSSANPRYELVTLAVATGNVNNRIQVYVMKADGSPALGVWVRHSFGSDFERFQFMGSPVQFNLGGGSHYSVPNDPPDHITIEGADSDLVRVGNSNLIGFSHTEWSMSFQIRSGNPEPPTPPEPGIFMTVAQFNAALDRAKILVNQ